VVDIPSQDSRMPPKRRQFRVRRTVPDDLQSMSRGRSRCPLKRLIAPRQHSVKSRLTQQPEIVGTPGELTLQRMIDTDGKKRTRRIVIVSDFAGTLRVWNAVLVKGLDRSRQIAKGPRLEARAASTKTENDGQGRRPRERPRYRPYGFLYSRVGHDVNLLEQPQRRNTELCLASSSSSATISEAPPRTSLRATARPAGSRHCPRQSPDSRGAPRSRRRSGRRRSRCRSGNTRRCRRGRTGRCSP